MSDLNTEPRLPLGDRTRTGQAQLTNMSLALRTLMDVQDVPQHQPRLALFYGFSGYGKTVAAAFTAARTDAVYISAQSIWTQRSILEAIAEELGVTRLERTSPRILRQIIDHLNYAPRPLIIDEMDHLVKKQSVEIIRDIHDHTSVGIMMIGEEGMPSKLKEWERFDNRIRSATAAQPASLQDARRLADHYCTRVQIADDLVKLFQDRCRGVTRRIVTNLTIAEQAALVDGMDGIDANWWATRPIATGDLPVRRMKDAA
ncbi:ATP-binding protein [Sphingobium aquiterrae]|uniref:ATP-binding protein n=1 Tax=Sphingobium aquiterrae TaxID=2038656 RepID=UPI003018C4AC